MIYDCLSSVSNRDDKTGEKYKKTKNYPNLDNFAKISTFTLKMNKIWIISDDPQNASVANRDGAFSFIDNFTRLKAKGRAPLAI